jgi:hypothetical protein
VRQSAGEALSHIGPAGAQALTGALAGGERDAREVAAKFQGATGDENVVAPSPVEASFTTGGRLVSSGLWQSSLPDSGTGDGRLR